VRRPAAIVLAAALSGCATARPKPVPDIGVADCAAGAASALLSVDALQCWLPAPHGRWRILSHDSHFDVLVVQSEALDLRDAAFIAYAFAANQGARRRQPSESFSEILVYVRQPARGGQVRTRRVRWTKTAPLEIFDFTARAGEQPR
jgi:hypothetical protein